MKDGNSARDDEIQSPLEVSTGRSFTSNDDILRLEKELVEDGVALSKRHIPAWAKEIDTQDELQEAIQEETAKDHPNKSLIGFLNERKGEI